MRGEERGLQRTLVEEASKESWQVEALPWQGLNKEVWRFLGEFRIDALRRRQREESEASEKNKQRWVEI